MIYTNNPVADYMAYDNERTRLLFKFPKCSICDEHITDEHLFIIEGETYVKNVLMKTFVMRLMIVWRTKS